MKRLGIRTTLAAAVQALFAAALSGGVNQWTTHGPDVAITALAADPTDPRTIYAASLDSGVFKSSDGGESWVRLAPHDNALNQVTCLAVDPTQPTTVYGGNFQGRFLKSSDGGASWEDDVIDKRSFPGPIGAIAVDTATSAIYVGTQICWDCWASASGEPVLKSTDGGNSWSATGLAKPHQIYALLADSLNQTVFAGTDFSYASDYYLFPSGGGVARSSDGGANWSLSATDLGSSVTALVNDPRGHLVYAGTASGPGAVYRSFDGGNNWELLADLSFPISALAVDPTAPATLYAATSPRDFLGSGLGIRSGRGVRRSTDGGASWRSFNAGMFSRDVTSLTIDSTGKILHAGTAEGVFDIEIEALPPPGPCAAGADHLCLFGSRFRVDLTAIDPHTETVFVAQAVSQDHRSGYFSFPSLTGDPTFPEVFVKIVDATSLPGSGYWVFYGGMTSVLYTLTITDTTTGVAREYSGEELCGGADVNGFLPGATALESPLALVTTAGSLRASAPELALLSGRFRITLTARHPETDTEAAGLAIPQADRFGYFSLPAFTGDPELPEVFVKMIDATGGAFLFFHTGLTGLPYRLTFVDTVTGIERIYGNSPVDPERLCGGADFLLLPE